MGLVSSVYRMGEPERRTPAEEERVRQQARKKIWRDYGLAVFDPADIADDWLRQAITNEANRIYGRRGRA